MTADTQNDNAVDARIWRLYWPAYCGLVLGYFVTVLAPAVGALMVPFGFIGGLFVAGWHSWRQGLRNARRPLKERR